MKNKFLILILCLCLMIPLQAAQVTGEPLTVQINGIHYLTLHTPQFINNTFYLSAEDLAAITYGTFTTGESSYSLVIQNKCIEFYDSSRSVKLNGAHKLLPLSTVTIDDTHYLPLSLLDIIDYPYLISGTSLSFDLLSPYSLATDTYKGHKMLETSYQTWADVFSSLSLSESAQQTADAAKRNNQYLSFINSSYKSNAFKEMKLLSSNNLPVNVCFRNLNHSGSDPLISDFTSVSLSYRINSDSISLSIGNASIDNNCFWAAFNPSTNTTSIDLSKSLDIMVMRCLYEYYRQQYDLKDDHHIEPLCRVQMGRSDYMTFPVYLDYETIKTSYEVIIYKQSMGNQVNYYVDFRSI